MSWSWLVGVYSTRPICIWLVRYGDESECVLYIHLGMGNRDVQMVRWYILHGRRVFNYVQYTHVCVRAYIIL